MRKNQITIKIERFGDEVSKEKNIRVKRVITKGITKRASSY